VFKKALALALSVIRLDDFKKRRQVTEDNEKQAVLRARSIGPKMVDWPEKAGYGPHDNFAAETPDNIAFSTGPATTGAPVDRSRRPIT
jgi:hypothetical protein